MSDEQTFIAQLECPIPYCRFSEERVVKARSRAAVRKSSLTYCPSHDFLQMEAVEVTEAASRS